MKEWNIKLKIIILIINKLNIKWNTSFDKWISNHKRNEHKEKE